MVMAVPVMAAELTALDSIIKSGKLRVGMEPGYMPFEMQNK
jgi:hypothetical protein